MWRRASLLVLAPSLFASSFVLTIYAESGSVLESLPRPVAIAAIGALAIQAIASGATRSGQRGAWVALAVLTTISFPVVGTIFVLSSGVLIAMARARHFSVQPFASALGMMVLVVFILSALRVGFAPAFQLSDLTRRGATPGTVGRGPDIFMLMLDAYPRSDTLADWGYDNSWFEQELATRGFDGAAASHTNYPHTALVLPSMFHMRHVSEIPELRGVPERLDVQRRALRSSLDDPPAMRRLRELGYVTVSTGYPANYITLNPARYIDGGGVTVFEQQLLSETTLAGLAKPLVLDSMRSRVLGALAAAPIVAREDSSTFLFAHIVSPHTPFLFDRSGRRPSLDCVGCPRFGNHIDESGLDTEDFRRAFTDQLHYLNGLVLEAIDGIVEHSPDAVIVVFSDHGSRANRNADADWYATFFAARTPGQSGVFPDDVRPISVFPHLFGAYFGDNIPVADDKDFIAPYGTGMPILVRPVTD